MTGWPTVCSPPTHFGNRVHSGEPTRLCPEVGAWEPRDLQGAKEAAWGFWRSGESGAERLEILVQHLYMCQAQGTASNIFKQHGAAQQRDKLEESVSAAIDHRSQVNT